MDIVFTLLAFTLVVVGVGMLFGLPGIAILLGLAILIAISAFAD